MRITIHLTAFDNPSPAAFAILWFDKGTRKWSRESHAGIDIPNWGYLRFGDRFTEAVTHDGTVVCVLEGLDLRSPEGPFEGESGVASWPRDACPTPLHGQWHVQWVDSDASLPESSVFADEA